MSAERIYRSEGTYPTRKKPEPVSKPESVSPAPIIPATVQGEWTHFADHNPLAMAHTFSLPSPHIPSNPDREKEVIAKMIGYLVQLSICLPPLSVSMIELLADLDDLWQQYQAAVLLNDAFGIVELKDRSNLPVVAVKHGLEHNQTEAAERIRDKNRQLSYFLSKTLKLINEQLNLVQRQIALTQQQSQQDQSTTQLFATNQHTGYHSNQPSVKATVVFSQQLQAEDQTQLSALTKQQRLLESTRSAIEKLIFQSGLTAPAVTA